MTINNIIPAMHASKKACGSKKQRNCRSYRILKTVNGRPACRHSELCPQLSKTAATHNCNYPI